MEAYQISDEDYVQVKKLFENPNDVIIRNATRSQLNEIYKLVYGFYPQSHVKTKRDVINGIRNYIHAINRAEAFTR